MKLKSRFQDASLWLTVFYLAIGVGATVFQMMVIVPEFSREIPNSMVAFAESHVEPRDFWRSPVMGLLSLLPILALVLHWKTPRRKWLLYSLILSLLGIAVTIGYFIPRLQIMGIITDKASGDAALLSRTIPEWIVADQIRFWVLMVPAFFTALKAVTIPVSSGK